VIHQRFGVKLDKTNKNTHIMRHRADPAS